jgi:hypothetical protein
MKVLTKNYGIDNGERKYLTYLMDDNNNALECFDTKGEVERSNVEMDLLKNNNLSTNDLGFMTLEEYYSQELKTDDPLILVFYLDEVNFSQQEMVKSYGENVKKYFDENGDNVRLFFMPTKGEERITCINPSYITDKAEIDKLNELTEKLEEMFQVGVD